ncbi:MAG TPA: Vms1/Ankzf1 family peptidyl-tRNA hydrolase [Steroidobacteraceae bacterium]|nr:Vms1/Ankzf1 family peptidyl-tRNA hydrolase [Steroidobacteraceae bacterium]
MELAAIQLERVRAETPGPARLLRLLETLDPPPGAITLLLAAGAAAAESCRPDDSPALRATLQALLGKSGVAESGLALFWSHRLAYALRAPLPPPETCRLDGWETGWLLELLGRPHLLGVFLLRRGGYTVGIFEGDLLVASKSGTRFVKNRHRKGGQSQRRFDRIREKQVDELFEKACLVARERLAPFSGRIEALFLGGDRHTVQAFRPECRFLQEFGDRLQARFLNTPEPRHETLKLACDMIWRSDWIELRERSV